MINLVVRIYRYLFARAVFVKWNKLLYRLSLCGLGVLNYENPRVSGELYFLKKVALQQKSKSTIIDVGANNGDYSLMCLNLFKNVNIYSFEPHPKTFISLMSVLSGKNVSCFNMAVSKKSGILDLFDYDSDDGSEHASLYQDVIEKIHYKKSVSHRVKAVALDDFIRDKEICEIDLLKIDTEGHELEVLKGARFAIKNRIIRVIHFEFNEMNVVSRSFFKDFVELLPGYDLFRLLPAGLIPLKYSPLNTEIFAYQNIVAFLRGGHRVI
jgi:FkbM family methyltransferase